MKSVKTLLAINTPDALKRAMDDNGVAVPLSLQQVISAASARNGFRTLLAVFVSILIAAGTYFSYKGAITVFSNAAAGYASIFFTVLDLAITYVIWKELLDGWKKWGILFFELLTFLWFGYTMQGYFGIGSLQSAANQKITSMYSEVNATSSKDANSVHDMMQQAKDKAASIKSIEESRDGKGIVFEKAKMISEVELRSPEELPQPPSAPSFKDLSEANAWMQTEKGKLDGYNEKLASYAASLKNSAKSSEEGVQGSINEKLSGMQRANLDILIKNLDGVAKLDLHAANIPAPVLTQADMKSEGVGSIIGGLVEGVIAVLLVMLTLLSKKSDAMEALRKDCALALVEKYLDDNTVTYDIEGLKELPYQPMVRMVDMMDQIDGKFLTYVKKYTTFNELVKFAQKQPVLVTKLVESVWKFSDVVKRVDADPTCVDYLADVLGVEMNDWDRVNGLIRNRTKAVQIAQNPETLKKFLQIVEAFESKLASKGPVEISRILNQLLPDDATPAYLDILHMFSEKLQQKSLCMVSRSFIQAITKPVANLFIKSIIAGNEDNFARIAQSWGPEETEYCTTLLEGDAGKDAQIGRLIALTLNAVGVEGLSGLNSAYQAAEKIATNKPTASKVIIAPNAISSLATAINGTDDAAKLANINTAIKGAFEVKQTS